MLKKIVNLTPHDVVVKDSYGKIHIYPYTGNVARVYSNYTTDTFLNGVRIEREVEPRFDFGIDKIDDDTIYIVSYIFAMKLKQVGYRRLHQFVYPSAYKAERDVNNWNKILNVPSLISCSI